MENWESFISEISKAMEIDDSLKKKRKIIWTFNRFFFVENEDLGKIEKFEEEHNYFSSFHKFWEEYYKEIIDIEISEEIAEKIARKFFEVIDENGLLSVKGSERAPPSNMSKEKVAQARFFSANQDYKIEINSPYDLIQENPNYFDPTELEDKEDLHLSLIKRLGAESQYDKRADYVKNSAEFLNERKINAIDIAEYYDNDAENIREALINEDNMGYSEKKTNMFIRDMKDLDVWTDLENLEAVDVASDKNTMRLALRTGLIKSKIPPLSSFFDIFCYQYSYFDRKSAEGWRRVWEKMKEIDEDNAPLFPGHLDYLIYNLGKTVCKRKITMNKCQNCGEKLKWNNNLKSKCTNCGEKELKTLDKYLPCEVNGFSKENIERIKEKVPLEGNNCIFNKICKKETKKLNPPNSISIKGKTGWNSARTKEGGGGGITS